ncbi:MAG: 3'-5' exonuclease [Patescibacteria group bacterium]|nr:3'-5' exonuclease [Patescibacteria group bacterium]
MEFNDEQKKIIESINGVFIISAPVGTGKTTILTERVAKAIESGIKPEEILCLTFTNRAAEEMSERIKAKINNKKIYDEITVKTFHGWCAYFIKAEAKAIGLPRDFVIFEEEEQREVMKTILEKHPEVRIDEEKASREISNLIEKVYDARLNGLLREIGITIDELKTDKSMEAIGAEYHQALAEQNALDFNELVLLALRTLYLDKKVQKKWASKYRFIQLDEFQDTHLSEYLVVKELAKVHQNVSFIGDLDQTIYTWRGSQPVFLTKLIKKHFPAVVELSLSTNYRFDPNILAAVKSFLGSFMNHSTQELKTLKENDTEEKAVNVFSAHNFREEISWVIEKVKDLREKEPEAKIVVISRTNNLITKTADIFAEKGVAHITVDKYEFFRRQEVKDVYAYLKIIFNRFDLEAAYRLVKRPPRNIGSATLKAIVEKGDKIGMKVSDFLNFKNYKYPEPFFNLINKFDQGRLIVLDTETTGTDVLSDDIVQIFAQEIINGKVERRFSRYLKNDVPVGFSETIHSLSDKFLKEKGENPTKVLQELKEFIAGDATIGHNVIFDLTMLIENGKRRGVTFDFKEYYDTLDLAKRVVESPNYRLSTLAELLGLATATHDAEDDVSATVGLLGVVVERLKKGAPERVKTWQEYSVKFLKLSGVIDAWQKVVQEVRPPEALEKVWEESGLKEFYEHDPGRSSSAVALAEAGKRLRSIEELKKVFAEKDNPDKRPEVSLRELIHYAALVKDINFLGLEKGKIPIVTAHQVKGLEFDYVFIIGMNEYIFPIAKSDLEEEKRLFYVAMTRAKKKIFISYSQYNDNGYTATKSRFIDYIDEKHINFFS